MITDVFATIFQLPIADVSNSYAYFFSKICCYYPKHHLYSQYRSQKNSVQEMYGLQRPRIISNSFWLFFKTKSLSYALAIVSERTHSSMSS